MKVAIIRHAESEYNHSKLLQGRTDCDLSWHGVEQINKMRKTFNNNYDVCFTSPLKRAYKTAKLLLPNIEIKVDDRLIERSLGNIENTKITEEKLYMLRNNNNI